MKKLLMFAVFALQGIGCAALAAPAQPFPARAVRLIVPFPAGGTSDLIARAIAQELGNKWKQSVIVENHGGAGGNIGIGIAARAPADGYTLLFASAVYVVNPSLYATVPYDPLKSFIPVSNVATSPDVFVVNPAVPAKSLKELAGLMRANPRAYSVATPGVGTTTDLSAKMFRIAVKADVTDVPYSGAGPAMTAVLGNQVPVGVLALPAVMGPIRHGAIHALAVTSHKRSSALPDVPTLAEAGYAGQESEGFQGLFAPAGTPGAVIAKISADVMRVMAMPEMKKRLESYGFDTVGSTPEQFSKQIAQEFAKWREVVRLAGIKAQ